MTNLEVSVVIPVYNRPDLLTDVLHGLNKQTFDSSKYEIIVCDDGSTDDIRSIVDDFDNEKLNMVYVRQANKGPAAARNLGIKHAGAEYVLFLDSDVLPHEKLIERLVDAIGNNSTWVGVEAAVIPCGANKGPLWDAPLSIEGGVYLTAAILYKKDILHTIGGFDQSFLRAACEDVELATRMLEYGDIGFEPKAIVQHPRRLKTFKYYWNKRKDWRYVLYLALRYGYIGWPGNHTKYPRARLAWCALVTQPAGRAIDSLKYCLISPIDGVHALSHAVFTWFCGVAALQDILFVQLPESKNYLK